MKNWLTTLHGREFKIMRLGEPPPAQTVLADPQTVAQYAREELPKSVRWNPDTENMAVVLLSARRHPIGFEIITNGTLDTLLVHPREVFKPAIVLGAHAIILAHNHPSGDPSPSEADIKVTRDLVRAGQVLKIAVLDHIVLGHPAHQPAFSSLRELGYMYSV